MRDFKFFQKREYYVEGELNPDYEPGGLNGQKRYLWRWSSGDDGVMTYDVDNFEPKTIPYDIYHMTWNDFMVMTNGMMVCMRYIIHEDVGIIEDYLPKDWGIDLNNDLISIKASIWL